MTIAITYMETDLSDGFKQREKTVFVPNYRTLRSLLSAVDAACMEIEQTRKDPHPLTQSKKEGDRNGVEL
jgi:hypothetical protein